MCFGIFITRFRPSLAKSSEVRMFAPLRFPIRARALLLLGVCVLALAALPPHAAEAAFKQNTIDNSVADFGRGQFQRAGLGSLQNAAASPKLPDLPGSVHLGPI